MLSAKEEQHKNGLKTVSGPYSLFVTQSMPRARENILASIVAIKWKALFFWMLKHPSGFKVYWLNVDLFLE